MPIPLTDPFTMDNSDVLMGQFDGSVIYVEYNKQQPIITKLDDAEADLEKGSKNWPLAHYGLAVGGRLDVKLNGDNDPNGQKMRNIWEMPQTRAGHDTAEKEAAARHFATEGNLKNYVEGFADATSAPTTGQYAAVVHALSDRQTAYKMWLGRFVGE